MKKSVLILLTMFTLFPTMNLANKYNIIPAPLSIVEGKGEFSLSSDVVFVAKTEEVAKVAGFFSNKIAQSTGMKLAVVSKPASKSIQLLISKKVKGEEAYELTVTPKGVTATASTPRGLFYAMQSFLQLLPPQIESKQVCKNANWTAPAVAIKDKPRFEYRGAMIDACRHFAPVEMVKHHIDVLSMYKVNNVHWHLTEDQGWRMEIKKYPELTKAGAWRTDDTGRMYGGFYTQEEMKEIVAYAAERFINIIPEFEMPGHELAAIAAYPWLSCRNVEISVRPTWGIERIVMCPGKETTFQFLKDVVDEMIEIFPSKYYHIGGDESPREEWAKCPLCQKKADELGLKPGEGKKTREAQLQSYIVNTMEKYLNSKGKAIIGWDEILEGGNLNQSAIVMSWRGESGGIAGSKAGHKVIMTPSKMGYYLDYYQGDQQIEPYGIGGYLPLEKTYTYDPVPAEVEESGKANLIWGPQGNVWAEFLESPEKFDYRMYPRIVAIAETGWSAKSNKDFKDFCRRLDGDASLRMSEHNVNYHIPLPEQEGGSFDYLAFTDKKTVAFQTTRPMKMVYTLDGSEPTIQSKEYTQPIEVKQTTTIKIASVLPSGKMSKVRSILVEKQKMAEPVKIEGELVKGLELSTTPGTYITVDDLNLVRFWEKKNINDLKELWRQSEIPANNRNVKNYAGIARGYIKIPTDGIYYFRANYPEMRIDGKKVIDKNSNPSHNHFAGGRSMALKAGYHEVEFYYLSYIFDGTPSWRGDRNWFYRIGEEGNFNAITQDMIYRKK